MIVDEIDKIDETVMLICEEDNVGTSYKPSSTRLHGRRIKPLAKTAASYYRSYACHKLVKSIVPLKIVRS